MWELGEAEAKPSWSVVETPFDVPLFGVAQTVEGPYAVGSRGYLVADRGNGWEVVFDDGPATRQNQLRAMDTTDDGERIWMLGSSGAMACYDVAERKKFDYSSPEEMTSTWEGITVSGERGGEKALASNGSGAVLPFTIDGFDVDWGQLSKPAGKGSKMAALASTPDGVGFGVDTSGNAFKTTPDEGWKDIGIVNAQVTFSDIYAGANQRVYVAAGDGHIYRYDDSSHDWTPIGVTDGTSLRSFDLRETEDGNKRMVVIGADGSIYERTGTERWEAVPSPTEQPLTGLELGEPDVAVGGDGTVVERPRGVPRDAGLSADGDEFDGRGENFDGDGMDANDDPEHSSADVDADTESEQAAETAADTESGRTVETETRTGSRAETERESRTGESGIAAETDSDSETAVQSEDSGISNWSSTQRSAAGESTTDAEGDDTAGGESAGADAGGSSNTESEVRSEVEASTETEASSGAEAESETDRTTEATADSQTKENVLVAIAQRTELDAVDVSEAAEHGSELIESVLVQIAEDVGINPERVRNALNHPPDAAESTETSESPA